MINPDPVVECLASIPSVNILNFYSTFSLNIVTSSGSSSAFVQLIMKAELIFDITTCLVWQIRSPMLTDCKNLRAFRVSHFHSDDIFESFTKFSFLFCVDGDEKNEFCHIRNSKRSTFVPNEIIDVM